MYFAKIGDIGNVNLLEKVPKVRSTLSTKEFKLVKETFFTLLFSHSSIFVKADRLIIAEGFILLKFLNKILSDFEFFQNFEI